MTDWATERAREIVECRDCCSIPMPPDKRHGEGGGPCDCQCHRIAAALTEAEARGWKMGGAAMRGVIEIGVAEKEALRAEGFKRGWAARSDRLDNYARLLAAAKAVVLATTANNDPAHKLGSCLDDLSRLVAELEGEK